MAASLNEAAMVKYTWQKRRVSARLLLWNVRNARNGTIRLRKIAVMIRAGWS